MPDETRETHGPGVRDRIVRREQQRSGRVRDPDEQAGQPVVADGYMYRFTVTSTYGPFEVTGTGALRKLEHEIWAIGQLKNITRSEAFTTSS